MSFRQDKETLRQILVNLNLRQMLNFRKKKETAHYQKPQSWNEIEKHFKKYFQGKFTEMLQLVRFIRKKGLKSALHGYTSGTKLIVSFSKQIDPSIGSLHVEYNLSNEQWLFSYRISENDGPHYVRRFSKELGVKKFEKFLKIIEVYSDTMQQVA